MDLDFSPQSITIKLQSLVSLFVSNFARVYPFMQSPMYFWHDSLFDYLLAL